MLQSVDLARSAGPRLVRATRLALRRFAPCVQPFGRCAGRRVLSCLGRRGPVWFVTVEMGGASPRVCGSWCGRFGGGCGGRCAGRCVGGPVFVLGGGVWVVVGASPRLFTGCVGLPGGRGGVRCGGRDGWARDGVRSGWRIVCRCARRERDASRCAGDVVDVQGSGTRHDERPVNRFGQRTDALQPSRTRRKKLTAHRPPNPWPPHRPKAFPRPHQDETNPPNPPGTPPGRSPCSHPPHRRQQS